MAGRLWGGPGYPLPLAARGTVGRQFGPTRRQSNLPSEFAVLDTISVTCSEDFGARRVMPTRDIATSLIAIGITKLRASWKGKFRDSSKPAVPEIGQQKRLTNLQLTRYTFFGFVLLIRRSLVRAQVEEPKNRYETST